MTNTAGHEALPEPHTTFELVSGDMIVTQERIIAKGDAQITTRGAIIEVDARGQAVLRHIGAVSGTLRAKDNAHIRTLGELDESVITVSGRSSVIAFGEPKKLFTRDGARIVVVSAIDEYEPDAKSGSNIKIIKPSSEVSRYATDCLYQVLKRFRHPSIEHEDLLNDLRSRSHKGPF